MWLAAILSTTVLSHAVTDLTLAKTCIAITQPGTYRLHGVQNVVVADCPVLVKATGRVNLILDSAFVQNDRDVSRESAMITIGEVHLYLKGKNEMLGVNGGITCEGRLYIHDYVAESGDDGQVGVLSAQGENPDANGIGDKEQYNGCAITIDGGDITAKALGRKNGIGGSSLTMTGGKVYAYSDSWGAGVAADTVLISGGILEANANSYGAGIALDGKHYTQTGGIVTAWSNSWGVGIGGSNMNCMGSINLQGGHLRTRCIANGRPPFPDTMRCPNNSFEVHGGSIEWVKMDEYRQRQGYAPRTNGKDSLYELVLYGLPSDAPIEYLSLSSFPTYLYNDSRIGLDGHLALFVPAGKLKGTVVVDGRSFIFDTTVQAKDSILVAMGTTVRANLQLNNGDWKDWLKYGMDLRWVNQDRSVTVPANGYTSLDSGTWKLSADNLYLGTVNVGKSSFTVMKYSFNFYLVQFQIKGTLVYNEILPKNTKVKLPSVTDLPCSVDGWYTDNAYTKAWKADSSVSQMLTLHGKPGADCPETVVKPELGLPPILAPKVDYTIPASIRPTWRQPSPQRLRLGHRFDLLGRMQ